jgi:hypothetical protein
MMGTFASTLYFNTEKVTVLCGHDCCACGCKIDFLWLKGDFQATMDFSLLPLK